jgi:Fe-S cluster assembly protein SufD
MTQTETQTETEHAWRVDFEGLRQRAAAQPGADWLMPMRERAMARFEALGLPTLRDEAWRFTDLRPMAATPFVRPEPDEGALDADALAARIPETDAAARLVFLDGHFQPTLSHMDGLVEGATAEPLATALEHRPALVKAHLGNWADAEQIAFTALNTALFEDAAVVHLAPRVVLERPIQIVWVSTSIDPPRMSQPRTLVVAERESEGRVVESFVSAGRGVSFSNAVTELSAAEQAQVGHYLLEEERGQAYNVSTLRIQQQRDSSVSSHTALLGGALARNNVHGVTDGENTDTLVNGLFLGSGEQHLDNAMRVEHAASNASSRQYYRGVLDEQARGVFGGRIVVRPAAQQIDAEQSNRNLLLSDQARINTRPQLEIYADNVKCTHGATSGKIDQQALFYLRARGIPKAQARAMLVSAFAHEILQRMPLAGVRRHLARNLDARLGTEALAPSADPEGDGHDGE